MSKKKDGLPDNEFLPQDKAAYEKAVKDFKTGKYIELEEYMKQRGLFKSL